MSSFNRVILMGNLTRNPELRYIPTTNTPVAKTGLAVNRRYKSNGEQREEVMFIDIVAYGRSAEIMSEYLTKGSAVMIEGRLSFSSWEQEGVKRNKHEVIVENFQMLGSRNSTTQNSDVVSKPEPQPKIEINDEDIPF